MCDLTSKSNNNYGAILGHLVVLVTQSRPSIVLELRALGSEWAHPEIKSHLTIPRKLGSSFGDRRKHLWSQKPHRC